MNLRVDLILPGEQRSASALGLKPVLRVASIILPAAVVLAGLGLSVNVIRLQSEVALLEGRWEQARPRQAKAGAMRKSMTAHRDTLAEITSWRNSRVNWHRQLDALQKLVPPEIQLRSLKVNQSLQMIDKKIPSRTYSFTCSGKATGESAQQHVQGLRSDLLSGEEFSPAMAQVTVSRYAADNTRNADRNDRIFEIRGRFQPSKFR